MIRCKLLGAALAGALLVPVLSLAAPVAVTVQDKGVKTLCAEEDNVYVTLAGPGVRRFEAAARHPAYGPQLTSNDSKANFTDCKISGAKDFKFKPRTVVLYEDKTVMVKGVTYSGYWRPEVVAVNVAGRRDKGFHLIQLFLKENGRWHESLVLHIADGYWRLRPLPMPQFKGAVYGTSFLVGPVEETSRPFVRIRELQVDPKAMSFRALFTKGGEARLTVSRLDHEELRLKVALDPPVGGGPFVALRSMYVGPDNADTAELHWTDPKGQNKTVPVVGFGKVQARAVGFERSIPSKHNTSAPDILFSGFED